MLSDKKTDKHYPHIGRATKIPPQFVVISSKAVVAKEVQKVCQFFLERNGFIEKKMKK